MKITYQEREFEIDKDELSRLAIKEYRRMMEEQRKSGFIFLHQGLFGILDGSFGNDPVNVPKCMACGSYQDYTGQCRYTPSVMVVENGNEEGFCKKDDIPIRNLIQNGAFDKYEIKEVKK